PHRRSRRRPGRGQGARRAPLTLMHVVATAGHVDHGKSTLVLALTGMDPDRFAEEKARGLTIDLGFAWTALPSGHELAFVDVAGTFLEGAEVVEVDAPAGVGVDELRTALDRLLAATPSAADRARPRLWIDRSFAARGSGTVVTGTLAGGRLAVDDELALLPAG